ncbi:ras and Rab interactor 2-like [Seriola lalandi dorsalis]|uniref:ras and Rab interactor 2-like n=1 Tax=Seriola lalandi dorsalis TaxID=1841481 RepID=UPI000C6FBF92|nr:ras and Rab interactor 2-like [Seriola lalandi dorsalis]
MKASLCPPDLALERAMFSCVLRPLKSHLEKALVALHNHDGSSQCLTRNLLRLKGDAAMERLGVRTGVPDGRGVERMKQKLILMQRTHSPIDKVLLLLQVCKCVHKAMGSLHGQEVSWEDFLPSLSYVIVECNRPHILIEVEYMMELLEPSWLGGEVQPAVQVKHPWNLIGHPQNVCHVIGFPVTVGECLAASFVSVSVPLYIYSEACFAKADCNRFKHRYPRPTARL